MFVRRLRGPAVGYLLVVALCTLGYVLIEGWSVLDAFWMMAITFTTIGYGEVHPLSSAGRMFTLLVIVAGVSLHAYTFAQITGYLMDGGLVADLRARREKRMREKLKDHFVVVGLGRLGREVAELLFHHGEQVVVIDPDPKRLEGYDHAALTICGDATSDKVLESAVIGQAKGLAVATGSSAVNVFVVLSARQLNPALYILCRIDENDAASKALRAGANGVISPYLIGGVRMAHALIHPNSARFIEQAEARDFPDLWIQDVPLKEGTRCSGTLGNLNLRSRFGVMVVAVRRADGSMHPTPGPEFRLGVGDVAVVAGRSEAIQSFTRAASGSPSEP